MTSAGTTAPTLAISRRTRSTPWSSRVEAAGVQSYTVYNHMLLPASFRTVEEDYWHLRSAVQLWDVACERQVEISGPDAGRLAQLITVRDLSKFDVGRCGYAPVCDTNGRLINDPVVLRVDTDRWWFSVADSDVVFWAGGLAHGLGLDVTVREPDVSPLAVQGPRADDVMALVFGERVRAIKFFRFERIPYRGVPLVVARTGWSAQGGFEIYVDDADVGRALYDDIMRAGEPHGIGPGCPNLIERIEAGLLSYGNDVTREHTALEAGLERYCALGASIDGVDSIGLDALRAQKAAGITRQVVGLSINGEPLAGPREPWTVLRNGVEIGHVTSAAWSPRLSTIVALAMIGIDSTAPGATLDIVTPDSTRTAVVTELPFPGARQR